MATTTTTLTMSTQAKATTSSSSATVQCLINTMLYWQANVSDSYSTATSTRDYGNGTATYKSGFKVTFKRTSSGGYNVYATGTIIDCGDTYMLTNFPIGSYPG
ncbi:hypothetical protein HL658_13135 [Azospirillum sp. RWY-5-1]|uniref:Uncharacterized protein n=1 Tax=Azospirillum oleiclasticum TaxID=2735135 RepID=A0ABX2TCA4_9PROT|nr:hypothetical protein [Azospirillum oleiclasticum]NYZ13498.1 hypothetical protein [Azospirillum oleiclasticum]NYZ20659.1 hypothetical protein [Azospirillum oleiclasticum]